MRQLFDLPDELICQILWSCAEFKDAKARLGPEAPGRLDLHHFSLTCKRAYRLAQPCVFSSLMFRRASQVCKVSSLMRIDPSRHVYVKDVAIVPLCKETDESLAQLNDLVSSFPRLQHLFIEIPWEQSYAKASEDGKTVWQRLFQNFDRVTTSRINRSRLPSWSLQLVTCHLNFQRSYGELRELDSLIHILAAPRIKEVTIVNAELRNFKASTAHLHRRSSPLVSFNVHSCKISAECWVELLSVPRALRKMSFFPHMATFWDGDDPTDAMLFEPLRNLVVGLTAHRASLTHLSTTTYGIETLLHDDHAKSYLAPFSELTSLTHIELLSNNKRVRTLFPLLTALAPSVQHLHISEDFQTCSLEVNLMPFANELLRLRQEGQKHHSNTNTNNDIITSPPPPSPKKQSQPFLPNLSTLTYECCPSPPINPYPPTLRSEITDIGLRLQRESKPNPIRFRLLRRTARRNAVPPYLWDEYVPEQLLWFDTDQLARTDELWGSTTAYEKEQERLRLERERLEREERERQEREAAAKKERARAREEERRRERLAEWKKFEDGIVSDGVEDETWMAFQELLAPGSSWEEMDWVRDAIDLVERDENVPVAMCSWYPLGQCLDENGNDRMVVGQLNSA